MLLLEDEALEDFEQWPQPCPDPNAVVIGLAPSHFHYDRLNEAFRMLKANKGSSRLIAIHKARYFKRKDGLALGPGELNVIFYSVRR